MHSQICFWWVLFNLTLLFCPGSRKHMETQATENTALAWTHTILALSLPCQVCDLCQYSERGSLCHLRKHRCRRYFQYASVCMCCVNIWIMCHSWPDELPWFHLIFLCIPVGEYRYHICIRKVVRLTPLCFFSPSPPFFSFPHNSGFPSSALIAIGQYSTTIETVDAGWCKDITDQGATQIAQSSKSLRYLGLMRCDKVTRLNTPCFLLLSFFWPWFLLLLLLFALLS